MESLGNIILYFVAALSIVVFSVLTVTTKKILRSATYLMFVLLATAVIYFQMNYEFLGAVQIAVYAGGIVVLFVFAIMLTHKPGKDAEPLTMHKKWLGLAASLLGVAVCGYALFSYAKFCGAKITAVSTMDMSELDTLADFFRAFGDTTRIRILRELMEEEICVNDLAEKLGMTQSAVSHQLRFLKQKRLVKGRRDGKQILYSLDDEHVHMILAAGVDNVKEHHL